MRLHVMSDLHLDTRNETGRSQFWSRLKTHLVDPPDALIVAGDIGTIRKKANVVQDALHQFEELYPQVFYVPGNHEFWSVGLRHGWDLLGRWQANLPKTHILKVGKKISYAGDEIGGDTLWFPDCEDELEKRWWCDYQNISDAVTQIDKHHQAFRAQEELPEIVVTHHFPTAESVASEWRGAPSNVFFCADLGGWLMNRHYQGKVMPRLWIHGHTHNPMDYMSAVGFRVYCNPYGYPNEGCNPRFWERLEVDTDPETWQGVADPLPETLKEPDEDP